MNTYGLISLWLGNSADWSPAIFAPDDDDDDAAVCCFPSDEGESVLKDTAVSSSMPRPPATTTASGNTSPLAAVTAIKSTASTTRGIFAISAFASVTSRVSLSDSDVGVNLWVSLLEQRQPLRLHEHLVGEVKEHDDERHWAHGVAESGVQFQVRCFFMVDGLIQHLQQCLTMVNLTLSIGSTYRHFTLCTKI